MNKDEIKELISRKLVCCATCDYFLPEGVIRGQCKYTKSKNDCFCRHENIRGYITMEVYGQEWTAMYPDTRYKFWKLKTGTGMSKIHNLYEF